MLGRTIFAVFVGAWLVSAPASAEQITQFNIGNWNSGAYTHTETGEFSHCAATAHYQSGISLIFAINRDLTWALGLSDDRWKLTEGDSYPVQYWVDRGYVYDGTATAVAPNQVKVPLPGDDRLFYRFRRGRMLTVVAANQTMNFSLKDTSRMLAKLFECAKYWRRQNLKPDANPFEDDSPDNPFAAQ